MPKGTFTVNSACKLALSLNSHSTTGSPSISRDLSPFWKKIWSLHAPNKIKTFTWRACHNILPTKENLYHRKVLDEPLCEACGLATETTTHLFWECTKAVELWAISALRHPF
ncbi:hypothetical protein SO802_023262 [Lithocarpus litseifolius]|uniref:Reverse transcriptase zinc-binding domain-containing protein n=1 Tax=Lithocarpus litseifolius TaxID=425828 RepID=A0AAW2C9Q3_9ROSI